MKKKNVLVIAAIIMSLVLTFAFTGCSGDTPADDNSTTEATTDIPAADPVEDPADDLVDEPVDQAPEEDVTALANEIIDNLYDDYKTVVDILNFNKTEPVSVVDGVDENGNMIQIDGMNYVRMQADYDTLDEILAAFNKVFTATKSDELKEAYFGEGKAFMKEVDGVLYIIEADNIHLMFDRPIQSAQKLSEDEILATTTVTHEVVEVIVKPYEILLKKENGEWKIAKLTQDGTEVGY